MSMTDPIADMLTRMRNALRVKRDEVDIPLSNTKKGIAEVLRREGYITEFKTIEDGKQGILRVYLKYGPELQPVISRITRKSKPGRRIYTKASEIEPVLEGLGIAVVSTNKGILTDRECRKENLGGEILCSVE